MDIGNYRYWGAFSLAELPNVAGSATQRATLQAGDSAFETDNLVRVECLDPTLGGAIWVGPRSIQLFGADSLSTGVGPDYLYPGYSPTPASVVELRWPVPFDCYVGGFYIRQGVAGVTIVPTVVTYTIGKNGVATVVAASLSNTVAATASYLGTFASFDEGDEISIVVTKDFAVVTAPSLITGGFVVGAR